MGKAAVAFPLLLKYTGVPGRVLRFVIVIYLYLIYLCMILTNVLFCYLDKQLKSGIFLLVLLLTLKVVLSSFLP